jgi:hypothetical protein
MFLPQTGLIPDVLNMSARRWVEVKPLTVSGAMNAMKQTAAYALILSPFRFHPDENWTPSTNVIYAKGRPVDIMNLGGVVFYSKFEDNIEELVVGAALMHNGLRMQATNVGRFVLAELSGALRAPPIPAAVTGYASADIEMSVDTGAMRAELGGF